MKERTYLKIDCGGDLVRVFKTSPHVDTSVGAILDAWARRTYGPRALVYSYRRSSWNNSGATFDFSVVSQPDRRRRTSQQAYSVLGQHQVYLQRDDITRCAAFLDTYRSF